MDILEKRIDEANSLLCVGLDSEVSKLPERFKSFQYPQFEFNKWIIDKTHQYVCAYKPNSAFYEARGAQGIKELRMTIDYIKETDPSIFVILDSKRADIGSTNNGYVSFAYEYLNADSITLHPYLGEEALKPFFEKEDKVSIILAHTSNPGAKEFQEKSIGNDLLWEEVLKNISRWNNGKNVMAVMGATYPEELKKARAIAPSMTFLVPGVGAQGGDVKAVVEAGKNSRGSGLIINSSRGIIFAEDPAVEALKLRDEINSYR